MKKLKPDYVLKLVLFFIVCLLLPIQSVHADVAVVDGETLGYISFSIFAVILIVILYICIRIIRHIRGKNDAK